MPDTSVSNSTSKNVPNDSSQPSAEDTSVGSVSSEGAEVAKIVSLFNADAIVQYIVPSSSITSAIIPSHSEAVFDIADSSRALRPGDMHSVMCLLSAHDQTSSKCDYVDILFLILIIQEELFADQRNARFSVMVDVKKTASATSSVIYQMKLSEAKETYKAEAKAAKLKIISASIGIVIATVTIVTACCRTLCELGNKLMDQAPKILKAMQGTLLKAVMVTQGIDIFLNITKGVVALNLNLEVAKHRYKANLAGANARMLESFFQFNIAKISDLRESYSSARKEVNQVIDNIRELLQKLQDNRLSVARNI
ncbi:MAG: hypothetical protein LBI56_02735 [Puniceicoccales bacterium]|jgi:hypothetical protein|nr:hypothetical protein [Puniceicoccales bacterium]